MGLYDEIRRYRERLPQSLSWAKELNWHENTPQQQALPDPFREISEIEWWQRTQLSGYSPLFETYDQLFIDGKRTFGTPLWSVHTRVHHEAAYAMASWFSWENGTGQIKVPHPELVKFVPAVYAKPGERTGYTVRFFMIGCVHKYTERTVGNCLHEYQCKLCGYTYRTDSSG